MSGRDARVATKVLCNNLASSVPMGVPIIAVNLSVPNELRGITMA